MGSIVGKSSTIIVILLMALVVAALFMPQIRSMFMNLRGETVTFVDTSVRPSSNVFGSDGTRDFKIITALGSDGIPAMLDPVFATQKPALA